MSTYTLYPSATHVDSGGTVNYLNGTENYLNLSDSDDDSSMSLQGSVSYALLPIYGSMPTDISAVTAIAITVRTKRFTKGDVSDIHKLQILKSDGTTALSSEITITPGTITTTTANYTVNPTVSLSSQSDWNDACLKITTDSGVSYCYTYEAQVAITYNTGGFSHTSSGSLILGGTSPNKLGNKYTSSGSLILGSTSLVNSKFNYKYVSSGSLILGGIAGTTNGFKYIATGSLILSGSATLAATNSFKHIANGSLILSDTSDFIIVFNLVTITYYFNILNYNFSIDAFKSRTILKSHMRIY